jgi:hypothetical protein
MSASRYCLSREPYELLAYGQRVFVICRLRHHETAAGGGDLGIERRHDESMPIRKSLLTLAVAVLVGMLPLATMFAGPATAGTLRAGPFRLTGSQALAAGTADQGLTTVVRGGRPIVVTRGSGSVAPDLAAQGWTHVGDPSSVGGAVLDAYQPNRPDGPKLFRITTAAGERFDFVHRLSPGEMSNNSFAAVAPGNRWFVSGEWRTMTRLLVFPVPDLKRARPAAVRSLPLATTIRLTHPVRDVQGCAFTSSTALVCSTNDPGTDLYDVPRQLLSVRLRHPLDGRPVTGRPQLLAPVPAQTLCAGAPGEVEGIDVRAERMQVAVNAPCAATTELFRYTDDRVTLPR